MTRSQAGTAPSKEKIAFITRSILKKRLDTGQMVRRPVNVASPARVVSFNLTKKRRKVVRRIIEDSESEEQYGNEDGEDRESFITVTEYSDEEEDLPPRRIDMMSAPSIRALQNQYQNLRRETRQNDDPRFGEHSSFVPDLGALDQQSNSTLSSRFTRLDLEYLGDLFIYRRWLKD